MEGGAEVVLGRQGSIQRVLNRVESLLLRLGSLECLLLGNQRMLLAHLNRAGPGVVEGGPLHGWPLGRR